MSQFAWVTLATNDSYSLGALVLAYSLKRSGTKHQLAILITPTISQSMRNKLETVFDLVQEVNVLDSKDDVNLALLSRPELGITFTKLHCWRLTQYEKCVFLDADIMVLQNSDELFDREEFSAAPDVGWPDCFNSGVFVFKPSLETFAKLLEFAIKKGSFDGGDQGLLNSFFSDWSQKDINKHLPFIYNTCSTACYSYLPAFKQFGGNVKILHFIGQLKPWLINFDSSTKQAYTPQEYQHLAQFIQMWWDLFCTEVHPKLSANMAGLAGALAQLTLGSPRTSEQIAYEESMRRQCWEAGNIDYLGKDSFDNIWLHISKTLETIPASESSGLAKRDRSPTPQPDDLSPDQRKEGIRRQTIKSTHETTVYQYSDSNAKTTVESHEMDKIQQSTNQTAINEKITSATKIVTEQANLSNTIDHQKTTTTTTENVEQKKDMNVQERIVTEVAADGKIVKKLIKTYPGEVTEIIEETETTEIGDQKTVKHTITESDPKPVQLDDNGKSSLPIDQPVVIIPGHQKVEFDPVTNSKIVTEKTTTGYQQTITTVTAEGKTITRVKTFYDPVEIPGETVEEEETYEETIIEPETKTETVTTTTTTSIEPLVKETKIIQDQSTKSTQDQSKTTTAEQTKSISTTTTTATTTSVQTITTEMSTDQVDQSQNQTAIDQKNNTSIDNKTTDVGGQTSVTEITEVTELTATMKQAANKTDQANRTVTEKDTTAVVKTPINNDQKITQIVGELAKDTAIEATLTQSTSESSKVTTETNKKTQELEKKFEQNVEIVTSAPKSTTVIKEQVQKEQRKQTTVSTGGQINVQQQQQQKTEQIEVQEEYEEVQSSQVTVSGKSTKKEDTIKSITQQQQPKAILSKDVVDKTKKQVGQEQQQIASTRTTDQSQHKQVSKKTTELTAKNAQESGINKKTTTTVAKKSDDKTTTSTEKQIAEDETIVTTSENGDVTTEVIHYFPGGREHTYKTVRTDGTTKTASKTFYDAIPVDPTKAIIASTPASTGKNEVKTTTAENGDVTTEEIRYFPGGREHTYHTVCVNGTTKTASKTFYDPVPVESEETEEVEEEEYEETVEESSSTSTSTTTTTSTQSTKKIEDIKAASSVTTTSAQSITGSCDSAKKKLPSAPASKSTAPAAASKAKGASATPVPPPRKKEVKNPTKGK